MNPALWILQGILALIFMMAGVMKLVQPKEKMAATMGWVEDFTQGQIRGIGVLEVMGSLGLILPMALNILPVFTPLAALGLALDMVGAFLTHLRRKEIVPMGVMNIMFFAMAAFVAIFRF